MGGGASQHASTYILRYAPPLDFEGEIVEPSNELIKKSPKKTPVVQKQGCSSAELLSSAEAFNRKKITIHDEKLPWLLVDIDDKDGMRQVSLSSFHMGRVIGTNLAIIYA
jgi:hypothetical protein